MLLISSLFSTIALLLLSTCPSGSSARGAGGTIPSFDFQKLSESRQSFHDIERAAKNVGAFALTGLSSVYTDAVASLKGKASFSLIAANFSAAVLYYTYTRTSIISR